MQVRTASAVVASPRFVERIKVGYHDRTLPAAPKRARPNVRVQLAPRSADVRDALLRGLDGN
jgi:hypothetical protein